MGNTREEQEHEDLMIEDTLSFYADPENYTPSGLIFCQDGDLSYVEKNAVKVLRPGRRARQALGWE